MDKLGFKSIFASRVQLTQVVVLFFIAIFNFFFFLDRPPVETWDEAIYGVNAFEMFQSGNIFQVTFGNQIDYSNLKPALGVILSALAFKFGGVSLFSLRFFSALSGFLSVFIVYLYSRRLFGSFAGFFSGMTLATTYGFVCKHAARNGDFDVVLTLFLLISVTCLHYAYIKRGYFYLSALALSFAFLTKSFAIIPIIPAILYFVFRNKTLRYKHYLVYLLIFFTPITLWFIGRIYQGNIESINQMFSYDFVSRLSKPIEGHRENLFYYFNYLFRFSIPWGIFFLASSIFIYSTNSSLFKELKKILLVGIWAISTFTLFTIAGTKLYWYIIPVYPGISIMCGWLMKKLIAIFTVKVRYLVVSLLIICFCIAEARIASTILKAQVVPGSKEAALLALNKQTIRRTICSTEEFSKSEFFIAEALKNTIPLHDKDAHSNNNCSNSLILIQTTKGWKVQEQQSINK